MLRDSVIGTLLLHADAECAFAQEGREEASCSPLLEGNFAPVLDETTWEDLRVAGQVPRELDGIFLRNGPNPQFPPRGRYHWFDGMIHGVRLRNGWGRLPQSLRLHGRLAGGSSIKISAPTIS